MRVVLLIILSIFSIGTIKAQIPTTGLVKDYKFTNGAITSDVNPLLNSGTTTLVPTGSARTIVSDRNSETNKAIVLNGDSFLAGGTNAGSVNNFTVSFWIKTTTNESPKRYILDQHNTATNPAGFSVALKDGKIYYQGQYSWNFSSGGGSNSSGVQQVISAPINDGQWHHVVCLQNSTSTGMMAGSLIQYTLTYTYSLYIDNVLVGSDAETNYAAGLITDSYSVRSITSTKQLVIGKSPDALNLDYQDTIDQIRYYERALTLPEIGILFNEDKQLTPLYVNANATGSNNGSSWANAYTNLQTAITAADPYTNEIWVAAGTYKPTGTARTATFTFKSNLKVYGGFNGSETLRNQRDVNANTTILSGDISGNDSATITSAETTRQDNAYHVISVLGNISNVYVDGFTISGGNANGSTLTTGAGSLQYYHTRGGAVYLNPYTAADNTSIKLQNCILEKNSGSDTGVFAGYFANGVSNLIYSANFESCIVRNNYSGTNAQFLVAGANGFGWYANATITNSLFHNNVSASGASCLYFSASFANSGTALGLTANVINCTFSNNTGANGNVLRSDNGSNSYFKNSIIYGNGTTTPIYLTGTGGPLLSNTISEGGQISGINSNPYLQTDYTLPSASIAINAGNNSYIPGTVLLDLAGNSRIVNTTVDLGAYEYDAALSSNTFTTFTDFSVFPNPTSGDVTIQSSEEIKNIKIYSLDGRELLQSDDHFLQISNLPSGIYVLTLENSKGEKGIKKIIKK